MAASGFTRVTSTPEERAEWKAKHPGPWSAPYRVQCDACKKRIWLSGLGVGSHRRACPGHPPTVKETSS
jgi:hypothetical protein